MGKQSKASVCANCGQPIEMFRGGGEPFPIHIRPGMVGHVWCDPNATRIGPRAEFAEPPEIKTSDTQKGE